MTAHDAPTPYDELNEVLDGLIIAVRGILGDDLVGAYLQGSFALGDGDLESDCDFLFVTATPVDATQEAALRALHDALPTRPGHWTRHLEGSYPPVADLRTLDGLGRPWLYVDHGWREMQWSTHCNTEVARWILRERGVTLTGPPPTALADPIPPSALRAVMRRDIETLLADLATWTSLEVAWTQRYAVATTCRILYTIDTGEVASKCQAMRWATARLDELWRPLIRQAIDDRPLGFDPATAPRRGSVDATLRFVAHAQQLARASDDAGLPAT